MFRVRRSEAVQPHAGSRGASNQLGCDQSFENAAHPKPSLNKGGFDLGGAHGTKPGEKFAKRRGA